MNRLKLLHFFGCAAVMSSSARILELNGATSGTFFAGQEVEAGVAIAFTIISLGVLAFIQFGQVDTQKVRYLHLLVLLIWITAVLVLTFHEPFVAAANFITNGFFGTWLSFATAVLMFGRVMESKRFDPDAVEKTNKYLLVLAVGSIVVVIQSTQALLAGFDENISGFALALGLISFVAAVSLYFLTDGELARYICILLWVFCLIGALVTTTLGPFVAVTNGYIAVWANTGAVTYMLAALLSPPGGGKSDVGYA